MRAGLGPHLHHRAVRVVVDEPGRFGEAPDGVAQTGPVRLGDVAGPEALGLDATSAASRRLVSSRLPISMEKNMTGRCTETATLAAAQGEGRVVHEHVSGDEADVGP